MTDTNIQETLDKFLFLLHKRAEHYKEKEKYKHTYPFSRWFVITGARKVGNMVQIIREQFAKDGLQENQDWFLFTNGNPNPDSIYDMLYDHNGKLLVLDGYQELLKGEVRYLFWKHLFEDPSDEYPDICAPHPENGHYYRANIFSSLERYYAEKEGLRPDRFKFTGNIFLLTNADSTYDYYVRENKIPEDYQLSLEQRARQINF